MLKTWRSRTLRMLHPGVQADWPMESMKNLISHFGTISDHADKGISFSIAESYNRRNPFG